MKRLRALLGQDLRLQLRYGFVYAGIFVAVFWIAILSLLPMEALRFAVPAFLFVNGTMTTFFFIGGLVLYEKREGVLEALVVSPVRRHEYLLSKVASLTLLAGVETVLIAVVLWGSALAFAPVLLGVAAIGAMNTLFGFLMVSRYDSVNEFLLPAGVVSTLLQVPVLASLGLWDSPWLYLWPTQGPLLLIESGFETIGTGDAIYAVVTTAVWIAVAGALAHRAFGRFIVRSEGAH